MATKTVDIPEIGVVTFYKRRGNRSLRMSVTTSGGIRVSLPMWLPYKAGEQFVRSKMAWIAAHRRPAPATLCHGQVIGKAHRLYFVASAKATKITTRLSQNQIEITHPPACEVEHETVQRAAQRAGVRALRKEAERLLPQRLQQLAAQTGFSYNSVAIRQLKSRWGSCSAQRDITLSLFLIQLSWQLIDYVLLHELTHTKVLRHGPPFWQELERQLPNAKLLRKEMRKHSPTLELNAEG